jgi:hypothetical protein
MDLALLEIRPDLAGFLPFDCPDLQLAPVPSQASPAESLEHEELSRWAHWLLAFAIVSSPLRSSGENLDAAAISVARFDAEGHLIVPEDIDRWVFLGSSLGMGYSQANFDPDSPGMFQVVRIEPTAYAAFLETGHFVDGTMIALDFHGARRQVSINRAGFVMGGSHGTEIHYKDSKRFPDGFNFYTFDADDEVASEIPLPNDCVECHRKSGAYEGVFVQFYPIIESGLPDAIRAMLAKESTRSGH